MSKATTVLVGRQEPQLVYMLSAMMAIPAGASRRYIETERPHNRPSLLSIVRLPAFRLLRWSALTNTALTKPISSSAHTHSVC